MVDVDLGDLHLEVIGQQANRLPHRAQAGPAWWLEERGRGRRAYRKQTKITRMFNINIYWILNFGKIRETGKPVFGQSMRGAIWKTILMRDYSQR